MVHLFSGRAVRVGTTDLWGQAAEIGVVCINDDVNDYAFSKNYASTFFTTAHEIGHLFGGVHSDGQNCAANNQTIMCQGETTNNFVFSAASRTRITNFLNSTETCLNGSIRLSSLNSNNHDRVCNNRTTRFLLTLNATSNKYTVQWRVGGTLRMLRSDIVSVDVAATSASSGLGWIEATVSANNTNDNFVVRRDNIPTGPENKTFSISGPSCVISGQTSTFSVNAYTTSYSWTAYDGIITSGQNSRIAYIRPTSSNGMYITVNATGGGDCGGPNGFASNYYSNCNGSFTLAQQMTAFPNPASETLHIQTEGEFQIGEMTIMDESSRINKHITLHDNEADIDVSDLKPGLYFIKFLLDGTERVERIIIE